MPDILSNIGSLFAAAIGWAGTIVKMIVGGTVGSGESVVTYAGEPLLLLFILVPLVGLGVGLFKRLKSV